MTQEELTNKSLNIVTEIFQELTESIKVKKTLALKYEDAFVMIEKEELMNQRIDLMQKWESAIEKALESFAAVSFLKGELTRINERLGIGFDGQECTEI